MSGNVFAQYLKEHLLKMKQTPARVGNLPKKPTTRDKIKPLSFQRVQHESGQLGVTWFEHFIMPSRMGKCYFQHMLLHLEK
jgi:hypothetical protein